MKQVRYSTRGKRGAVGRATGRWLVCAFLVTGCTGSQGNSAATTAAIETVLNDWHDAASKADQQRYFGHMAAEAVFLGTDASERWTMAAFRAYVEPYFSQGKGWTYRPHNRSVMLSADHRLAWFDEQLSNEKYGELRGTGVLRKAKGKWKIVHYSMVFTVPNGVAKAVVETIRRGSEQSGSSTD